MVISVLDKLDALGNPDLQAALDSARDGDVVKMVPAVYVAPSGGFRIKTRIELLGEGPGSPSAYSGAVLVASGEDNDVLVIEASATNQIENLYLHDFRITRPEAESAAFGRNGISNITESGRKISNLIIERVSVSGLKGSGFSLIGTTDGDGVMVNTQLLDCEAANCDGNGLALTWAFMVNVMHCRFTGNGLAGLRAENSQVAVYQGSFDGNDRLGTEGNLRFVTCPIARVDATRIANFGSGAAKGCVFDRCGGGGMVGNCFFDLPSFGGTGIEIADLVDEGPILVLTNRFRRVQTLVKVGANATACIVMPQFDDPVGGGAGTIALPSNPNNGLLAVPHLNRPGGNALVGLVLPGAPSGQPTLNVQDGTLAYDHSATSVLAHVAGDFLNVELVPARVADLAVTAEGKHSLVIRWTSLGADSYDFRRSTSPITEANFSSATEIVLPTPGDLGTAECFTDTLLTEHQTYYYAIKGVASNVASAMSNVPTGTCEGPGEVECV